MNNKIIVIEGIDGVGKTFMCNKLKIISNELNISSEIIPEFMDDFAGGFISSKLKTDKFISLSDRFDTSLAQTFFLISSHLYKYEIATQKYPNTSVLIFDRFLFSVLAYQIVLLEKSNKIKKDAIEAFYNSIKCLLPENIIITYLSCDRNIINKRFETRGEHYSSDDFDFLDEVKIKYEFILKDCNIPVAKINTSYSNNDEIYRSLKNILEL
jgi:thymidylate kinase